MKILYAILLFDLALLCWANASPPPIPRGNPVPPVATCEHCGALSTGNTLITNWVYVCDYQTNVNGLVTEFRTVNVTNSVAAYPKTLIFRVESTEDLTSGDWQPTGQEFLMRLGTNQAGFYRVKGAIE